MKVVCEALRFPEGPIWMPGGDILLVEIEAARLTRMSAGGVRTTVAQMSGGANGAAIGPDGCCYVCNNGGFAWREDRGGLRPAGQASDYSGGRIERVDLTNGKVETLFTDAGGHALCGPKDIVFDGSGGFWLTDAGKGRPRDMDRGGVYYLAPGGDRIEEAIYPMLSPNGIGLSANEDQLYVSETQMRRLWCFDLTGPGRVHRQPWPSPNGGRVLYSAPRYQLFDSLAVDAHGYGIRLRCHADERRDHDGFPRREGRSPPSPAGLLRDESVLCRRRARSRFRDGLPDRAAGRDTLAPARASAEPRMIGRGLVGAR